eukprot:207620-Karenia_brevis.AAC.1
MRPKSVKPEGDQGPYQMATPHDAAPLGLPRAAPSNCAERPHVSSGAVAMRVRKSFHPNKLVRWHAP